MAFAVVTTRRCILNPHSQWRLDQHMDGEALTSAFSVQRYHVHPISLPSLTYRLCKHLSFSLRSNDPRALTSNSQIKNVDKSKMETSTYEGRLVFYDLHFEEGVQPPGKVLSCSFNSYRSSIISVFPSKSQNPESRRWKSCYHGTGTVEEGSV